MEILTNNPKCIRCGVCCIIDPCSIAQMDKSGICSFLTIHKEGYTSCKYIEEHGNPFSGGCLLRRYPELYEKYKKLAERSIGMKLVGIDIKLIDIKTKEKVI